MSKKHLFILLFLAPLLALVFSGAHIYYRVYVWTFDGPAQIFQIKSGQSFGSINYQLKKSNLINSSRLFHRYTKLNGEINNFKVGRYQMTNDLTMDKVLVLLTRGKSISTRVTIPEGKNLFEIAKILENKGITKAASFIKLAKDQNFTHKLGIPGNRVEGYLYPDTYNFQKNTPARSVIVAMTSVFNKKVKKLNFKNSKLTLHQVIILASIVEKETGAKVERPTIAGVFHNRLSKRMRLQSDPTTIYGIYESYNGNLRKRHLLEKTPYNTYKIPALPIGPISNPGLESIKAVLTPQKHSYLYFVSKNDGTHVFSKNYRDHKMAVNKWQKNRKNRKGKSWRDLKQ